MLAVVYFVDQKNVLGAFQKQKAGSFYYLDLFSAPQMNQIN